MAHAVVKDGPYFSGTGTISFGDLRSQWLGVNSGPVKASTFFRNLNRDEPNPIVGDCTENADIASDPFNAESFEYIGTGGFDFSGTGRDWKISQMRDSIKSYTINQTDSGDYDKNVDGDNLEWNSNLDKTIPKYYNIQGNIHAVTELQPPATGPDEALKFVSDNITNLKLVVSGSVLGSGGKGGTLNWWRPASESTPLNSQWSTFMGEYAVYVKPKYDPLIGTHVYNGTVTIPTTGNYSIDWQVDNIGTLTFQGQTATWSSYTVTKNETYNNVPAGKYPISFTVENVVTAINDWDNNPGGIAIKMTDASNNIVWSTKQIVTVDIFDNPGTGEPGGHAITLNSDDGKGIVVSVTNNGKIYGGGGGGGKGGKGSKGPDGVYFIPRVIGGTLASGLGEWYTYSQGGGCGVSDSGCGDSTNDTWHWSVDEFNYSIENGGTGYQVGDIVEINNTDSGEKATAEVTSVNASVGAYISDGTDGNNPGDIVATGNGTKQIKIRMGWNDSVKESIGIGQYKVPSLGIDFTQGIITYSRGGHGDDDDSSPWTYENGRFFRWPEGDIQRWGYGSFETLLREGTQDGSGWRYVGYGPDGVQVPTYSRNTYQDDNGNPNETAPWTQIVTVTGGNVYPCTLIRPQNVTGRDGTSSYNFYNGGDNNESAVLNGWFFFTNKQQRMYFKDADEEDGNTAVWLSEADETISFGYKAYNDPNANNNTDNNYNSSLPVVGENYVDGIKILTGGTKYTKSVYDNTTQTTSGGSGSGLTINVRTARGWLRDAFNTKHETQAYNGDTLKVTSGTYVSNKQGGGCDRRCRWNFGFKAFCWHANRNYGPAYCIIQDPAMGIGAEGGDGGYGGQGRGSNGEGNALMPRTAGSLGIAGAPISLPDTTTAGGNGGDGGAGGDWGEPGGDGDNGNCLDNASTYCVNPEDGFDGGVAGRAIFGTNYTVNDGNFNSDRVKGEYQPSQ